MISALSYKLFNTTFENYGNEVLLVVSGLSLIGVAIIAFGLLLTSYHIAEDLKNYKKKEN